MSLVFPFIATMLCSVIVLLTYSTMSALEDGITDEITAVNGYARIYIDSDPNLEKNKFSYDLNRKYDEIVEFLKSGHKDGDLSIEEIGYLRYDKDNHMPVKIIGLSNLMQIRNKLSLNLTDLDNLEGKILIGEELSKKRIFNLGYFTWVEQQGISLEDFEKRKTQEFWNSHYNYMLSLDNQIKEFNNM